MFQDGYWRNQYNFSARPTISAWPGLDQAEYIGWADQARPNFQNSAWTSGLAWQATRRLPGTRPGRQL